MSSTAVLDAIHPNELRTMVENCIAQHIDPDALDVLQTAEASEREWLSQLAAKGVA